MFGGTPRASADNQESHTCSKRPFEGGEDPSFKVPRTEPQSNMESDQKCRILKGIIDLLMESSPCGHVQKLLCDIDGRGDESVDDMLLRLRQDRIRDSDGSLTPLFDGQFELVQNTAAVVPGPLLETSAYKLKVVGVVGQQDDLFTWYQGPYTAPMCVVVSMVHFNNEEVLGPLDCDVQLNWELIYADGNNEAVVSKKPPLKMLTKAPFISEGETEVALEFRVTQVSHNRPFVLQVSGTYECEGEVVCVPPSRSVAFKVMAKDLVSPRFMAHTIFMKSVSTDESEVTLQPMGSSDLSLFHFCGLPCRNTAGRLVS